MCKVKEAEFSLNFATVPRVLLHLSAGNGCFKHFS